MHRLVILLSFGFLAPAAAQPYVVDSTVLNSYDTVRPRLLLDSSAVAGLKGSIASPPAGTHWREMWLSFKTSADAACMTNPPAYVTPGVSDEELWQRDVGDKTADNAFAYLLTKTNPPAGDTVSIEAEEGAFISPSATGNDATVSGGRYYTTTGTAVNSPNALPPTATYPFSSRRMGYYHLWIRVYAPNTNAASCYVNIDGEDEHPISLTTYGAWTWIHCGHWSLTPGYHAVNFTVKQPGLLVDKYIATLDFNLTPTGNGPAEQHWLEAENFTLNANGPAANPNNLVLNTTDAQALGSKHLAGWSASEPNGAQPAAGAVPDAQQPVTLNGGNYDVWVRFKSPLQAHDYFYLALDGGAYSQVKLDGTIAFPYNTIVPPQYLTYNGTLTLPYNGYAYKEWVWKKVGTNVALAAGSHTVKVSNGGSGVALDRVLITPTGTATPTDPNKYLASARNWALASCRYPTWGTGDYAGDDLGAAHQLTGLALLFDWARADLGDLDEADIMGTLAARGADMYNAVPSAWWTAASQQNHYAVSLTGLTFAGLALHGETGAPNTLAWLQLGMAKMNDTLARSSADGADHEGVAYWSYEAMTVLKYMDLSKKLLGADMFSNPWMQQTGNYRLYFNLPMNSAFGSSLHLNFSDSPGYDWNGPDFILRKLASQYNQPTLQWLAQQYDTKGVANTSWLNLVWYNPAVIETSPAAAGKSTYNHFDDLDFAVSRSGWDGDESVVAFQCGPFMGHGERALNTSNYTDWGSNHTHPDANHFCVFGNGEYLLANEGYTYKFTQYANSLLISGAGQLGEGGFTFSGHAAMGEDGGAALDPSIDDLLSYTSPSFDYMVGNATLCYHSSRNLEVFRRHLLFLKPDVLIDVDDVKLRASHPHPMELHFFPKQQAFTQTGDTFTTVGTKAKFNFTVLQKSPQVVVDTTTVGTIQSGGNTVNRVAYRLSSDGAITMTTSVGMAWSAKTGTPRTITYLADDDGTAWKFKVGNQTVVLDRNATSRAQDEKARLVTCLEAESVSRVAPVQVYTDEVDASAGSCIATPTTTASNIPDALASPSASYSFTVPATASYAVWARVKAAAAGNASFYSALNPTGSTAYATVTVPIYGAWVWVKLTSASMNAGANMIALKYRQPNCRIDQLIITSDVNYTPYGKY